MADLKVKAKAALYDGQSYRKENDVFVIDAAFFDETVMEKVTDNQPVWSDTPENRIARDENAMTAAHDFGQALAEAGADPAATAEAVAVTEDAPKSRRK